MRQRLISEEQVLDTDFRASIIEEIEGPENLRRKREQLKRYEVYKDQVDLYVNWLLLQMFDERTVFEMRGNISNIGISRKIIDKLARVYSHGVIRSDKKKTQMKIIDLAADLLNMTEMMKKTNRFLKLFKTLEVMVKPFPIKLGSEDSFGLRVLPMAPYLYDVLEDDNNREVKRCLIISNFNPDNMQKASLDAATENRGRKTRHAGSARGNDGVDQTIADHPLDDNADLKHKRYIWWTDNYHFTTDGKGTVIDSGEGGANPIGIIPSITFAEDQDNAYWSIGGDDITDGSILVNMLISNMNHIGVTQGYGQAVVTGKGTPEKMRLGPNSLVRLEHGNDDPTPSFGFANASPPLQELKDSIVMYVAMMLSTNNLSTTGVKVNLESGSQFPSGIAMLIDQSESIEDVHDQQKAFKDNEPKVWEIYNRWAQWLDSRNVLAEDFQGKILERPLDMELVFPSPVPIMSEADKLEVIKIRKELGINTLAELMQIDNPDLSDEQAMKKIELIEEEKVQRMEKFMPGIEKDEDDDDDRSDESDGREEKDDSED